MFFEVKSVDAGSPARRGGIRPKDKIISINGEPLIDYVDYVYFCSKRKLGVRVLREGRLCKLRLYKCAGEDLGLSFTRPLLGKKRVCKNRCVFCFVDQLPKGMRKSLYLKDEDWRYSLIMGNYVTLSSIEKKELKRMLRRKASPLYISVHTVDEKLRRFMLGNKDALPIRPLLRRLARAGVRFHAQAVVCPGYNDGGRLRETIKFLFSLYPAAASLAVVPVGLTGHREGLFPLQPVTPEMAVDTIKEVEKWQKECLNRKGTRFVFAADEYYIRAGAAFPDANSYEGYAQIENGVGLARKFISEAHEAFSACRGKGAHVSAAAGQDAYSLILELARRADISCGARVEVYPVANGTFGGGVGVSGLLGGRDILRDLRGKELGDKLLISKSALRGDNLFIDDMTLAGLSEMLGVPVIPVADGYEFAANICEEGKNNG
ncbi:MAG: DUF512 domain-containing protein [Christensenellales bacterium]